MKDEKMDPEFEALMRDAARTYNAPPEMADPDATWRAIESALPAASMAGDTLRHQAARRSWTRPWTQPLVRMAAMLLVGVAVGRASVGRNAPARDATSTASIASASATDSAPSAEQVATDRYLARTEALLAGLPDELRARRGDAAFLSRADALLLQTRLLLDSPAAADPALRALLDDLEVVLAQVVRLDARRDPVEVDFLHEALEQRDVLPRLREAVADNATE